MCICIIFMHSDHPGSYSRTCHFSMKQLAPCFSERRPLSKADSKTWAVFPAMSRDVEQSSGRTGSSLATSTVGKWVSIRVKKKHDIYARPKEIWRLLDVQKLGLQPTPSTSKVLQLRSPFNRIGSWDHSGWSFATCWLLETNLLRKEHFLVRLSRKPQRLQDQHLSACQNHDLRWSSLTFPWQVEICSMNLPCLKASSKWKQCHLDDNTIFVTYVHLSFLVCRWRNASSSCNLEDSRSLPTFIHHTRSIYFNLSISFLILRSNYPDYYPHYHTTIIFFDGSFPCPPRRSSSIDTAPAATWPLKNPPPRKNPSCQAMKRQFRGRLGFPAFWNGNHRCFQFPVSSTSYWYPHFETTNIQYTKHVFKRIDMKL